MSIAGRVVVAGLGEPLLLIKVRERHLKGNDLGSPDDEPPQLIRVIYHLIYWRGAELKLSSLTKAAASYDLSSIVRSFSKLSYNFKTVQHSA